MVKSIGVLRKVIFTPFFRSSLHFFRTPFFGTISLQWTMYNEQCTMNNVQWTMYNEQTRGGRRASRKKTHPWPFDGSRMPKPWRRAAAARSQLEPSLKREGAGGRSKPSLGKEGWVVVKKNNSLKIREGWGFFFKKEKNIKFLYILMFFFILRTYKQKKTYLCSQK